MYQEGDFRRVNFEIIRGKIKEVKFFQVMLLEVMEDGF